MREDWRRGVERSWNMKEEVTVGAGEGQLWMCAGH